MRPPSHRGACSVRGGCSVGAMSRKWGELVFDTKFGPAYTPGTMREWERPNGQVTRLACSVPVLALFLAFSQVGVAAAQDVPAETSPAPAEGTEVEEMGARPSRARGAFGNVDAAKVPVDEKRERMETMLKDERESLARVVELLREARASKDIVQLNCVNEKLTQVKGLLKISEQSSLQMYEAIASNAGDLVNHEYTKVVVAHQKSQVLRAEAEQCVGESSVYGGATEVEVDDGTDGEGGDGSDATSNSAPPPGPAVPPVASAF